MRVKILGIVLAFFMAILLPAFSADIDILATMTAKSTEQNRVWTGAFQLVWNDFMDRYVHGIVRFREGTPPFVCVLNKKAFKSENISGKCYYKYSGVITKNTISHIKKAIYRKFKETSDILDNLSTPQGPNNYIIYAMLKKDFEFLKVFDKLGSSEFGKGVTAEYFGIDNNTAEEVRQGVQVLYYRTPNDFAVKLLTKNDEDEVLIYKNGTNTGFSRLYRDMNYKTSKYIGDTEFGKEDALKIPNLKFDVSKSFGEVCNRRVMTTNITIAEAMESVKFNMDNKGVQLKSEAAMTFVESALISKEEKPAPRHFYCDDTFVIFLREKNKEVPYFALRVNDITKFQ